jgi:hypothetical protein
MNAHELVAFALIGLQAWAVFRWASYASECGDRP